MKCVVILMARRTRVSSLGNDKEMFDLIRQNENSQSNSALRKMFHTKIACKIDIICMHTFTHVELSWW